MGTSASIGCRMPNDGKIYYVDCHYDGYLSHVGRILEKHYCDIEKVLGLLLGGDIVALYDHPTRIERVRPMGYERLEDCDLKEASCASDYLLNSSGDYKYLYDGGMWYVVDWLGEEDCHAPLRPPIPLSKAIDIWSMRGTVEMLPRP